MADSFETIFDLLRVEPIVRKDGTMTDKFAQALTFLVSNSNSTGEIIDNETLSIESIAGGANNAQISELTKMVEDLSSQSAQKTNESSKIAEMQKQIEELQELIAHVS